MIRQSHLFSSKESKLASIRIGEIIKVCVTVCLTVCDEDKWHKGDRKHTFNVLTSIMKKSWNLYVIILSITLWVKWVHTSDFNYFDLSL